MDLHVRVHDSTSSTRFRSRPARVIPVRKGWIARVRSHPRAGHRLRKDAPPYGCEGALGQELFRSSGTKAKQKGSVIRRRADPASVQREGGAITREDTRVRECDLIMCRVASSTRRRAIGGLIPASASNRERREARAIEPGKRTKSSRTGVAPYDSRRAW